MRGFFNKGAQMRLLAAYDFGGYEAAARAAFAAYLRQRGGAGLLAGADVRFLAPLIALKLL